MEVHNGSGQPTFVVRIGGGRIWPEAWAIKLAELGFNLTIEQAIGTWEGRTERGVTFTLQGDEADLMLLLEVIADHDEDVRWVHVEEHRPFTYYVDLQPEAEGEAA